jgi:hypothetical protein
MSFIFALALRGLEAEPLGSPLHGRSHGTRNRGIEESLGLPSKQLLPDKE